jgi:multidrug efflux pump subunit AcrB
LLIAIWSPGAPDFAQHRHHGAGTNPSLPGGEMWEPMAVTIMAGLLFSTVLTLGVVPVLYAVLFRVAKPQS